MSGQKDTVWRSVVDQALFDKVRRTPRGEKLLEIPSVGSWAGICLCLEAGVARYSSNWCARGAVLLVTAV